MYVSNWMYKQAENPIEDEKQLQLDSMLGLRRIKTIYVFEGDFEPMFYVISFWRVGTSLG